ncbi:MAG: hypothetical protein MUP16_05705 [Sedimentisphaerales bacterium]|nr:hypothetical protein [Sedimentisphaerales bacterium]
MDLKFLREALFGGMTANAFKLGTVLTLGWFWVRQEGCQIVYRGQDGNINQNEVQAVVPTDDSQVIIPYQELPENTIWHYVRRAASHCGLESPDSPVCIIQIDAAGDMLLASPNPPSNQQISQSAGGKFLLRWRYSHFGEAVRPTGFNIYINAGELLFGSFEDALFAGMTANSFHAKKVLTLGWFEFREPSLFNFDSPYIIIRFTEGIGREFRWLSDSYSHNQRVKFIIRSYNADAGESQNTDYLAGIADHLGPDAITGLISEVETL